MTTKAFRKDIASLALPKGRKKLGAFVAEGTKCVLDTISYFTLRHLIATPSWIAEHQNVVARNDVTDKLIEANRGEIGEMSSLALAPDVMAVFEIPADIILQPQMLENQLVLALDRIQDPGNLGTILRTADWMGITTVLASAETADCFNPKAVQASMGAISRVKVIYGDLCEMLDAFARSVPIYGTFLGGNNIYTTPLSPNGIVVMGNEGRGISAEIERYISQRLFIPPYPEGRQTSESLNVATATAIVLSEFRARSICKNF